MVFVALPSTYDNNNNPFQLWKEWNRNSSVVGMHYVLGSKSIHILKTLLAYRADFPLPPS